VILLAEYILEAVDVEFAYPDGTRALKGVSMGIEKGKKVAVLGPNGAGKTTSINMMVGLLRPTSGQVLINGQDLEDVKKGIIGICPQELVLWDFLTCKESLMLMGDMYEVPRDELKLRVEKLLDDLFLQDKANTVVNQLSGGMKRRLNLAMAVVHQPEIVVLDEPSEGLDPQSRRVLWNYIRHLRDEEGKTVILTTHLMDEADRLSDRIAIIDHGKLLRLDTPSNLKKEIGEGDVVEMKLSDPAKNEEVVDILALMDGVHSVVKVEDALNVRALENVEKCEFIEKLDKHQKDEED